MEDDWHPDESTADRLLTIIEKEKLKRFRLSFL
jgi:hypothetical protein